MDNMGKLWTDKEIEFLENNYNDFSNKELSKKMDRSSSSIEKKLKRLGLKKSSRSLSMKWSDEDIKFLKDNYSNMTNKELSEKLKRSPKTILNRASKMGLYKSKSHISKVSKERITNKSEKSIQNNFKYNCKECETGFNTLDGLQTHISKLHDNINLEEYYINNIGVKGECVYCGHDSKFISFLNGYSNKCGSEECLSKSRASSSQEWHMSNYGNLEKMEEQLNKRLSSLSKGDKRRLDENPDYYKEKSHNSKEYWMKRGYTLCESINKSKEVVEYMQSISHKLRKENPEKYKHTYNTKLEYYLELGHDLEESKRLLSERQTTFSKEICIEKYGKEKGIKVWLERQEKWLEILDNKTDEEKIEINYKKMFGRLGYSKSSVELFDILKKSLNDKLVDKTYYATHNGEFIRYNPKIKSHYRLDFVNTQLRKCIEYNGDFWHCNPEKYDENHIHKITNKTASEIWEYDKIKKNFIKKEIGFDVLVIWESDYKKDKDKTIQKCLDFLLKKNKELNAV